MAEEDFFRTSIEKIVSDASIREKLVVTASRMLDYLDHKFSSQKTHMIENIELDSFRVDISIIKRSNSKFNICVYENEFIRNHTIDDDDTPKKYYRAISTSIKDLVVELIDLLHIKRYDKRSNSFETILGTAEIDFLTSLLPEGSLDYLKCSVCLDYYNNHTEIFSCSHTLCRPCQQKFIRGKLSCPLCRAKFGLLEEEDNDDEEEEFDYDNDDSSSADSYDDDDDDEEEEDDEEDYSYLVDVEVEREDTAVVETAVVETAVETDSPVNENS